MEAQIAHKIHPQEGPLPFARQRLVNFEHQRGRHREILPPKMALFGFFETLKEAAFKVLHKNSLRDHAPHSGGKHNFIKITKNYQKIVEINVLYDTCTKGTAGDTRNSYPRGPPMSLVWEKWLWLECRLNSEGRHMGKFDGNKLQSGTFSLNFGCQMEIIFEPLHANDFQNCACRSSGKQNL